MISTPYRFPFHHQNRTADPFPNRFHAGQTEADFHRQRCHRWFPLHNQFDFFCLPAPCHGLITASAPNLFTTEPFADAPPLSRKTVLFSFSFQPRRLFNLWLSADGVMLSSSAIMSLRKPLSCISCSGEILSFDTIFLPFPSILIDRYYLKISQKCVIISVWQNPCTVYASSILHASCIGILYP